MDAPPLDELADRLGIDPADPELIRQAFVHSSFHNENPTAVSATTSAWSSMATPSSA